MQPVNHDMDDLMRRAAAGYPVKPQGADWEKVAQQLGASGTVATKQNGHGHLKKLLLMLPFLLAAFVCDRFFVYEYGHLKKVESPDATLGTSERSPVSRTMQTSATSNVFSPGKDAVAMNSRNEKKVVATASEMRVPVNTTPERGFVSEYTSSKPEIGFSTASTTEYSDAYHVPFSQSALLPVAVELPKPLAAVTPLQRIKVFKIITKKKNQTAAYGDLKKFYISLLAGPDVSRVKGQKMEKAGYSIGVIAGYNINPNWAVESGVLWDRKNYYSKGEYFKTDHLYLPPHAKISQVAGYCAMFEIPVNVRYNVFSKKVSTLFASAGASSYLMQKEDYDYVYRRYNQDYTGNKVYKKESKNWMAIGNVSVGYEHRLAGKASIRVEPYIRIPLRGVGIGSLPLRSTGILVGITHPVH